MLKQHALSIAVYTGTIVELHTAGEANSLLAAMAVAHVIDMTGDDDVGDEDVQFQRAIAESLAQAGMSAGESVSAGQGACPAFKLARATPISRSMQHDQ